MGSDESWVFMPMRDTCDALIVTTIARDPSDPIGGTLGGSEIVMVNIGRMIRLEPSIRNFLQAQREVVGHVTHLCLAFVRGGRADAPRAKVE